MPCAMRCGSEPEISRDDWNIRPACTGTGAITLPIPDWLNRIIFGRGSLANPLGYSSIVPVVAALTTAGASPTR